MTATQKKYIHKPFAWLNVDKFHAEECQYVFDLGLTEYYPAIRFPLEAAINALLEDRPAMPSLSSSRLPKIDRDVLNDPIKLRQLVSGVTPLHSREVTEEQIAAHKSQAQGVYDLGVIKTAYNSNTEPEFRCFDKCSYRIDGVDLQALQLLAKLDHFYDDVKSGAAAEDVLFEFGLVYYFFSALEMTRKPLINEQGIRHVINIKKTIERLKGGQVTKDKSTQERAAIGEIALAELRKPSYRKIKLNKLPLHIRQQFSGTEFVPWNSVDFASTSTRGCVNDLLKKNPIRVGKTDQMKSRNSVSENTYTSIVKQLAIKHPDLFRKK